MRKRPLFMCACVFLTALLFVHSRDVLMCIPVLAVIVAEMLAYRSHGRKKLLAGRCVLLLSAFLLGGLHMATETAFREEYLSKMKDGHQITVWGEVKKTEFGEKRNSIYLSDCYIYQNGETRRCNDVIVYSSKDQFEIGTIHKITGKIYMFATARNEGGFDSRRYYQSLKIDFAVEEEQSQELAKQRNPVKRAILEWKAQMKAAYSQCASAKTAGFLTGMILGDRSGLDKELKNLFTDGGLAHILAISGLHVSIIGRGCYRIARKRGIGFAGAGILAGGLLLAYGFLVGNGMSAVRAIGMMLLFFAAQILGRSYDMLNALGAMVLLLLWDNPFLVDYSGFWFSVTALLGVGFVGSIWGRFGMSVGISLTTLPFVALGYYEIPLYSPLTNYLLLPLLTPIFTLGLLGGILAVVFPQLGAFVLLPCEWGLTLYEWVCGAVAKLWCSSIGYRDSCQSGDRRLLSDPFCGNRLYQKISKKRKEEGPSVGICDWCGHGIGLPFAFDLSQTAGKGNHLFGCWTGGWHLYQHGRRNLLFPRRRKCIFGQPRNVYHSAVFEKPWNCICGLLVYFPCR